MYKDCYYKFEDNKLTIANSAIERVYGMTQNLPVSASIKNLITGQEWCADNIAGAVFQHPAHDFGQRLSIKVSHHVDDDFGFGAEALVVEVFLEFECVDITWTHKIYPNTPVIRTFITFNQKSAMLTKSENALDYRNDPDIFSEIRGISYTDYISVSPSHCDFKLVRLNDQTDDYTNVVHIKEGILTMREKVNYDGNILFVNDKLSGNGFAFIKECPTPLGRVGDSPCDFAVAGHDIFVCGFGCDIKDNISTYTSAIVLYEADNERRAMYEYNECIHKYTPWRDSSVMCNTWGDQSYDGKISETFLFNELDMATEIGITFFQIDDGWQKGITGASVVEGGLSHRHIYDTQPDFWDVNPERLPNGLEPIMRFAKEKNIKMGIWFSPDESENHGKWERDRDALVTLHKKYGIVAFKIDGIDLKSKLCTENTIKMLTSTIENTSSDVYFNVDVTAGSRFGYFGGMQYGNIFLENRFTDGFPDLPNYYPYRTLRSLWDLSHYIPLYRIQAEFLNVDRNKELYKDDVLAPSVCGIEYTFAITMFACPLAWMELTGLSRESINNLKIVSLIRNKLNKN